MVNTTAILEERVARLEKQVKTLVEGVDWSQINRVIDDVIEDGFGSAISAVCPSCGKKTMQVVRPGKFQCSECG